MVGINGLGRIGRLLVRRLMASDPGLIRALNDPADLKTVVHLLRHDSVHGLSPLHIEGIHENGEDSVVIEGRAIPLFHATEPGAISFPDLGIEVAVESSGKFVARESAARHLRGSVRHCLISAPAPDADFTVIAPVNGQGLDLAAHRVISNASCTAHATAPMVKVLEDTFGIEAAGMSTVHVATNDQRLLDLPHKDRRRTRAAFKNIIPTTSSAFGALHRAMPALPEGFSGFALRVPTLSVNLVDITATLKRPVTVETFNSAFREAVAGPLTGFMALAHPGAVSSDFTGRDESVVMDLDLTRLLGDRFVKVFGWHDNETGYAARLAELVKRVSRG
ncbi:MAG TPA: glyceraldehyde 3-phosphate dehydrogenase NAD-binding domain-containing protein [Holophagaceae bacterium]|jgi:glyceraldehyde 3-phosphate dehydrogenase|nr:glyceraldehyde 3-phosphate dehydrogenase NAD-binding domain-containing protein [Holophagaceae bacterium]